MIEIKNLTGAKIYWITKNGQTIDNYGELDADLNLAYRQGLILYQYDNKTLWIEELNNNGINTDEL